MNITVYCGSNTGKDPRFQEAAQELGAWIGGNGHTLVYGRSSIGLMGIVARAALASSGRAIGVETQFFMDAGVAQEGLTQLCVVDTMAQRKAKMIELGDAFVALSGGVGTLEEIAEIMSCIRLGQLAAPCCFLNIAGYYEPFKQYIHGMLSEGFISVADIVRFKFPESVAEFAEIIQREQADPSECCPTASELMKHE